MGEKWSKENVGEMSIYRKTNAEDKDQLSVIGQMFFK
jgi:hypothetical protein